VGACAGNTGVETCTAGNWGGDTCNPFAGATTEVCDNIDNDCDGIVDENLTQQCGVSDVGECQYGTQTCSSGSWGDCVGNVDPIDEICDSKDNNCNGEVDEGGICTSYSDNDGVPDCAEFALTGNPVGLGVTPQEDVSSVGGSCDQAT
jgi:hypothetical protein